MKIVRDGKEIELTDEELFRAYQEQERIYDMQNIEDNMAAYLDEKEHEQLEDNTSFIEKAACILRERLDEGWNYDNALSEAFNEAKPYFLMQLKPLTWEQVCFLWKCGNRDFFRTYDDGSEACIDLDVWESLVKHHENGGGFAIETEDIFKWEVVISSSMDAFEYTVDDSYGPPDSENLIKKCRERGISGELHVCVTALTVEDEYADEDEYFVYISPDYKDIYRRLD